MYFTPEALDTSSSQSSDGIQDNVGRLVVAFGERAALCGWGRHGWTGQKCYLKPHVGSMVYDLGR
jgi:hypothetical protein